MSKKFVELNAFEMMGALVQLAEPVGNLAEDDKLWKCFQECTAEGLQIGRQERMRRGLRLYAKIVPLLLNEEHKRDTLTIISIVEGKPVQDIAQMGGADFLHDLLEAWKKELRDFFIRAGRTARTE